MGRKSIYSSAAEKQAAYRERKRNSFSVTKCPACGSESIIPVSSEQSDQLGFQVVSAHGGHVVLCFACNGFVSHIGDEACVWEVRARAQ